MSLQPLNDRVILQRLEPEKVSPGGIIIPTNTQEKSQKAIVVGVGPGKVLDNGSRFVPQVKVGDIVFIGKYSGQELMIDGIEHLLTQESEIIGIYTEDTKGQD